MLKTCRYPSLLAYLLIILLIIIVIIIVIIIITYSQTRNSINHLVTSTHVVRMMLVQTEMSEINSNSDVEGIKKADRGKF